MAQYVMSVLDDTDRRATAEEMAAIDVFNAQMQADGPWVFPGAPAAPSAPTVVDARDGEPVFTDGPYVETKEFIIGFWIIDAPHLDGALRLGARAARGRHPRRGERGPPR